jgi:hypothetical protein
MIGPLLFDGARRIHHADTKLTKKALWFLVSLVFVVELFSD